MTGTRGDGRAARSEAVRIVPLYPPEGLVVVDAVAPAPPSAHLTYHEGHLLRAVEVMTIFWGTAWTVELQALAGQINDFFDAILVSQLLDQLNEYSVAGQAIGHGTRSGTATVTTPPLSGSISDAAIQRFLEDQIASNPAVPPPSPNSLYFVYLPPGITVEQGGSRSCQAFCGYHDDIAGRVFYAVMPYPECSGCTGTLSTLEALTSTSSHELCEAITDAVPGQGWYDDAGNAEIGDLCAWRTKEVAGSTVQLEWSNAASACV